MPAAMCWDTVPPKGCPLRLDVWRGIMHVALLAVPHVWHVRHVPRLPHVCSFHLRVLPCVGV